MQTEKVLVVYEVIPSETKVALVDMTSEERSYFFQANGYAENVDEFDQTKSDVLDTIASAFESDTTYLDQYSEKGKEYFGEWIKHIVPEEATTLKSPVQHILRCSFYL